MLSTLNPKQKEAVLVTEGPMLIIAGAGSGKTMVLTHKIAHLVLENGVSLDSILAVTFTNKAALEMKERVLALLQKHTRTGKESGAPHGGFFIGTFHSVCLKIIREHALLCDRDHNFVIADTKAQESAIKSIMEELHIDEKQYAPELFLYHISKLKNKLIGASEYAEEAAGTFPALAAEVYHAYERTLKQQNAVDFDDIIMLCVQLLKKHSDILAKYQERFQYLFIDEYQDTNQAQYQFTRLLAKKHGNICVVGDSDQAIYGWRQADMSNILNFEKDYPTAVVFVLEENYRSTQTILHAANMVIRKNKVRKEKNLFTRNEPGAKISIVATRTETDEAEFVAKKIQRLTRNEGYTFSDFAVLYRTNAQSRVIEETFMKHGITYRITGGFKFYDRKEIRDMLAYLRLIHNDRDTASLKRAINTPPRGIGKASLEKFLRDGTRTKHIDAFFVMMTRLRETRQTISLGRFIKLIAKESGMEQELRDGTGEELSRWENILELASAAASYGDAPAETVMGAFLDNVALVSQEEKAGQRSVNLMTMHAAKGLEFPVVFIVGAEDNIFPHQRSKRSPEELEEERRLCYVAITRAQKCVYFLYAKTRRLYGQTQTNPPSRFLFDIPEHLVSFQEYRGALLLHDLDFEDGIIDIDTA